MTRRTFALLTDFGLDDPYTGQLKAALFSRAPVVPILDISHAVPPFSVMTGALFLFASRPHFPAGTIFLCIVDPGVGSGRDILCLAGQNHILLGPDNGLLALAWRDMAQEGAVAAYSLATRQTPDGATFHGRDIIAPAAAELASGAAPADLGPAFSYEPEPPSWAEPEPAGGGLLCTVLHVDRFGNCVLNLPISPQPPAGHALPPTLTILVPHTGQTYAAVAAAYYAQLPQGVLGLIPGSQRFYELACARSSAAALLQLKPGDACLLDRSAL